MTRVHQDKASGAVGALGLAFAEASLPEKRGLCQQAHASRGGNGDPVQKKQKTQKTKTKNTHGDEGEVSLRYVLTVACVLHRVRERDYDCVRSKFAKMNRRYECVCAGGGGHGANVGFLSLSLLCNGFGAVTACLPYLLVPQDARDAHSVEHAIVVFGFAVNLGARHDLGQHARRDAARGCERRNVTRCGVGWRMGGGVGGRRKYK